MDSSEAKMLPYDWDVPEDVAGGYAMNLIVQHSEHDFIIYFFESYPPLIFGPPEITQKQVEELRSIKAKCIARIVVNAARMPEWIRVLQENYARYQSKNQDEPDQAEDTN